MDNPKPRLHAPTIPQNLFLGHNTNAASKLPYPKDSQTLPQSHKAPTNMAQVPPNTSTACPRAPKGAHALCPSTHNLFQSGIRVLKHPDNLFQDPQSHQSLDSAQLSPMSSKPFPRAPQTPLNLAQEAPTTKPCPRTPKRWESLPKRHKTPPNPRTPNPASQLLDTSPKPVQTIFQALQRSQMMLKCLQRCPTLLIGHQDLSQGPHITQNSSSGPSNTFP